MELLLDKEIALPHAEKVDTKGREKVGFHGLWVSAEAVAHLAECRGQVDHVRALSFRPFAWVKGKRELKGSLPLNTLRFFKTPKDFEAARDTHPWQHFACLSSLESQFLVYSGKRLFENLSFQELRRCQLDIEVAGGQEGFPSPQNPKARVLAIGLRGRKEEILSLEENSDAGERDLLLRFQGYLESHDPDTLEGHNLFNFDLDYLRQRCERLKLPCRWGRFGQLASFTSAYLKVAERNIAFRKVHLPGRTVFDTYLAVQLYDIGKRQLPNYRLKDLERHFGFAREGRVYLQAQKIERAFYASRELFNAYLKDDLQATRRLANILLPNYFAQTQTFPTTLQEAWLRGSASKVELLLLEQYWKAGHSLPEKGLAIKPYEGALTFSTQQGVYSKVLHYDVASLYPSLLLQGKVGPTKDELGAFLPLLRSLKQKRESYQKKAEEAKSKEKTEDYLARAMAYKILSNSFYGYLGFSLGRFSDGALAAKITQQGRQLLEKLMRHFEIMGCTVLEADTDGLYVQSDAYFEKGEALLKKISTALPQGIRLEQGGTYQAMFCYAPKNYALRKGDTLCVVGSALRARNMEPYLKTATDHLIRHALGMESTTVAEKLQELTNTLKSGQMPLENLAAAEWLSQSPQTYLKKVEKGDTARRASFQAALRLTRKAQSGELLRYYLAKSPEKNAPQWQRAYPLEQASKPYEPTVYLKKLEKWRSRYQAFLGKAE